MRHTITATVSLCALTTLVGCSSGSSTSGDASSPASTSASESPASTPPSSTASAPASGSSSSAPSSSVSGTSGASSSAASSPSSSTTAPSPTSPAPSTAGAFRVEITSVTYANGAYDAVVTTRPGATFNLAPATQSAAGASPSASAGAVCTAGTKGVEGMLTTYSVHCPGEQNAATLLIVRVAGGGSGASVATPLAVGTTP